MPLQSATWAALALVLTVIGAAYTYLSWRRRGPAAGVRGLAWTLLPLAALLTGTLRLGGRVVDAVTSWAANLVFNPFTWLGVILAGVSVVLFGASATMKRHGIGTRERPAKQRRIRRAKTKEVSAPPNRKVEPMVDDVTDIEAILKKHGIS
ncbi:MAG: hypothetical protein ABI873_17105 [Marmoricola sp.]